MKFEFSLKIGQSNLCRSRNINCCCLISILFAKCWEDQLLISNFRSFIGCLHLHKTITRLEMIGFTPVKYFSYIYIFIMFVLFFFYMFACFCIVIA